LSTKSLGGKIRQGLQIAGLLTRVDARTVRNCEAFAIVAARPPNPSAQMAVGIDRAAVFSDAYGSSNPFEKPGTDEYARLSAENDWVG
jgi:hypothetical protein